MVRRILITGWVLYFLGAAFLLVFPRPLVRQGTLAALLVLGLVLVAASVAYAFAAVYRRMVKSRQGDLRESYAKQQPTPWGWRPAIDRGLAVGWALFAVSALVAWLFPRATWSPSPEVLLVLSVIVVVPSLAYAACLVLSQFTKRLRR